MNHLLDITTSTLASSCRFWHGTLASKTTAQPKQMLILFDQEGNPECRLVREVLTELNLDVIVAPCPAGGLNITKFKSVFNGVSPPMLVDLNSPSVTKGAIEIVRYLFKQYKEMQAPREFASILKSSLTSKLATGVRFGAGIKARPSQQPDLPLILYSFESSPFSRPVRERLCELELTYILINLGKQQFSDMGLANIHWTLKTYRPLPNTKRDEFFRRHGNVQVPYLIDPNTSIEMFESKDILRYLQQTYAV